MVLFGTRFGDVLVVRLGLSSRLSRLAGVLLATVVVAASVGWWGDRLWPTVGSPLEPEAAMTRYVPGYKTGPYVTADAAILMDARTGTVLYGRNEHQRRAPASTTKILTAILALERARLDDQVTVAPTAANVGGSQIYLRPGERMTVEELLKGLMLRSGNDAAVALAEHIAGSERAFAELMTKRASELGALNSTFRNPNGLPAAGHYTTAYDLAMITRRGLELPDFRRIVRTREDVINWSGEGWQRRLMNTNRLLWSFYGADGVKTGTTSEAGQCLVTSATRDNWQLISVVLHSDDRWSDSVRLLEWGFANFRLETPVRRGQEITRARVFGGTPAEIPLLAADNLAVVIRQPARRDGGEKGSGEKSDMSGNGAGGAASADVPGAKPPVFETRFAFDASRLTAPVTAGTGVGKVWIVVNGETAAETDLVAGASVKHRGRWWRLLGGTGITGVE